MAVFVLHHSVAASWWLPDRPQFAAASELLESVARGDHSFVAPGALLADMLSETEALTELSPPLDADIGRRVFADANNLLAQMAGTSRLRLVVSESALEAAFLLATECGIDLRDARYISLALADNSPVLTTAGFEGSLARVSRLYPALRSASVVDLGR